MDYARVPPSPQMDEPRFVVCFDYGTTFSGVSWVLTRGEIPSLNDISTVSRWGRATAMAPKVPSLYTYSANAGSLWGYDIGDNAYVIRWSKLELEKPSRFEALMALKRTIAEARQLNFSNDNVLQSQIPRHLVKSTPDVITDYLLEVAKCLRLDIEAERDSFAIVEFPFDLVITHPADWDYRARNHTFRAVNEAFRRIFPESLDTTGVIRLATEPEACAQYTMKSGQDDGIIRLRPGQCFIVVDAGGGTVDLVSYLVEQVEPEFKVRKITDVSGRKCGASRIDDAFLFDFLPERLGDEYNLLTRANGVEHHGQGTHVVLRKSLQTLLERFQKIKHNFAGRPPRGRPDSYELLDLVEGVGDANDPSRGIRDGQLQISSTDLETMFENSINGTIELINKQLAQVDQLRHKVDTIFLSGGFSQSPYLYKKVQELARGWNFNLVRPQNSWSAVSQGGVLMGLGLGCVAPPISKPCPCHIGVVLAERWTAYDHNRTQKYVDAFDSKVRAKENIKWLVTQGDLITEDEGIEMTQDIVKKFNRNGNGAERLTLVFLKRNDGLKPPTDMTQNLGGAHWTVDLDFNLGNVLSDRITDKETNTTYEQVEMQLDVTVNQRGADFVLLTGRTRDFLGNVGAPGICLANSSLNFETIEQPRS